MKSILFLCVLLSSLWPHIVFARSCDIPTSALEGIDRADLVFKGVVVDTSTENFVVSFLKKHDLITTVTHYPDTYSIFKVLESYKGSLDPEVKIYYRMKGEHADKKESYREGEEYLIYAYKNGINDYYQVSWCPSYMQRPDIFLTPQESLNFYKKKIAPLNMEIQKNPKNLSPYMEKANLYESVKNYKLVAQSIEKILNEIDSGQKDVWTLKYASALLKGSEHKSKVLTALDNLKSCSYKVNALRQILLLKSDRSSELDGSPIRIEGESLQYVRFNKIDISNSDFRGTHQNDVRFFKTNIKGSNFSNSFLTDVGFYELGVDGVDFSYAHFERVEWRKVTYDCTTKFPEGFDPQSEALINKDGKCD